MVLRDGDCLLYMFASLDDRGSETHFDMPLNMAVKELDSRIIGLESDDDVAVSVDVYGISPCRRCRESGVAATECTRARSGALADLELMSM